MTDLNDSHQGTFSWCADPIKWLSECHKYKSNCAASHRDAEPDVPSDFGANVHDDCDPEGCSDGCAQQVPVEIAGELLFLSGIVVVELIRSEGWRCAPDASPSKTNQANGCVEQECFRTVHATRLQTRFRLKFRIMGLDDKQCISLK